MSAARELRLAAAHARARSGLEQLAAPLIVLATQMSTLAAELRRGRIMNNDVAAVSTALAEIQTAAATARIPIGAAR